MRHRWSADLLRKLDIRLQRNGPPPSSGCLLVANHVSWLDIFVINSLAPAGFISKAEVRRWPAIGWMAARNDTLFLRRGNRHHAELISRDIGAMLQAGHDVALFPEGMTTDGTGVRHFHAKLLQPAITYGCPVQGLAIRYRTADDRYCAAASYDGGISLWQSLKSIIAEPVIIARVDMLEAVVPPPGTDRRELANELQAQIAAYVENTKTDQPPT